jgi:hypothetical protein
MGGSVYIPRPTEGSELCQPLRQEDYKTLSLMLNGEPRRDTWQPIPVLLHTEDRGRGLSYSHSPWLHSDALIFRETVIKAVGRLLLRSGELLPLTCSDVILEVFNPFSVADALDEEASSIQRFSSGDIMRIKQYVFHPHVISGKALFKIPNLRSSPTFVSDHFIESWHDADLKGLEFRKIWECV